MRVQEILDYAFMQTGQGRISEIPNDARAHALNSLNIAYAKVWQIFPWQTQKEVELDLTSVLGTLTIPNYLDTITSVRIGNRHLHVVGENLQARLDPAGLARTGTPWQYMYGEPSPVLTQPASAGAIRIKSSSTADTSAIGVIRIHGLVAGVDDVEELTLNGTTNVDGSKSFSEIRRISKPVTTGRITVLDTSNTEFGTVAPWSTQPEYPQILLIPTPLANETITVHALRKFQRLVSENDSIEPVMLEPAVVHLVQSIMYKKAGNLPNSQDEERLSADAIKIAATRENEIADKDFRIAPDSGMFGTLGDTDHSDRVHHQHYVTR